MIQNFRSPKRSITIAAVLAGGVALTGWAPATSNAAPQSQHSHTSLDTRLNNAGRQLVKDGAPAALIDARVGAKRVRQAHGYRDISRRAPARISDRFRIGSVTKAIVAVAVLKLEQQGRLDIDDPVQRWLPGILPSGDARKITIRMLLNHSSGLADYMEDNQVFKSYFATGDWNRYWSPTALAHHGLKLTPHFKPGADVGYSNTNYVLAGLIIQRVTGVEPGQWTMRHVIQPLHMRHTTFPTQDAKIDGRHLEGYLSNHYYDYEKVTKLAPSWANTAGAVVSTVGDVAKFSDSLWGNKLLPPAQMAELTTLVTSTSHPEYSSGLGQGVQTIFGHKVWVKDGAYPGYFTKTLATRDGHRRLTYAVNSDSFMIDNDAAKSDQTALERAVFCPGSR